ncbi:hypothetical protein [Salipaludibacillus daqingensis]|uniref:hypothetical protein n=1 Tax=Salipaludibacillus daqingensis TaxID=3041001 RepID=UPI00247451A5|nr:hypothetical protein [Salipaludibacillus daqingensis]
MSATVAIVLGLAVLVLVMIILFFVNNRKMETVDVNLNSQRKCENCHFVIPNDYQKSLCPQCKTYLSR